MKKKKSIHPMRSFGLLMAGLALILLILIAIVCGNKILDASKGSAETSTQSSPEESTPEATTSDESTPEVTTPEVTTESGIIGGGELSTLNYKDVKAMWLSQFDLQNVYTQSGKQRSQKSFETLITRVLDNVKANGINTVYLQVRPYADSFYPSEIYPSSRYAAGAYGKDFEYDPVEIIVKLAHERGLSIHAWINPLRGMTASEISSVDSKYKIKEWYTSSEYKGKYVVTVDSRLYLNPAYEETRKLIIDGAREILQRYDMDGVHMDDYFYPTQDASFDSAAYAEYKKENPSVSLANFRKESLNKLISGLYSAVKEESSDALFGISPAGVIATVTGKHYADVYTWCKEDGYIDYICPQVYFGLKHQTCDFVKICKIWRDIIKNEDVKLIIGMTLGKAKSKTDAYAGSGKNEWAESDDILKRCLGVTKDLKHCVGVSYFCYQYFYDPVSGSSVRETAKERDNFIPLLKEITWQ